MKSNACKVCGGSDLNLVDGFYYCVECGTQDQNIQERIVETVVFSDGTHAKYTTKKIYHTKNNEVEMSAEWYKWHAYNFILSGLTDELIAAGAKPSVRNKILWIWTRYIKKYQVKQTELLGEFFSNEHKEHIETELTSNYLSKQNKEKENHNFNTVKSSPLKDNKMCCSITSKDGKKDNCNLCTQDKNEYKENNSYRSKENNVTQDDDDEFLLDSDEEVSISSDEDDSIEHDEFSFKNEKKIRNMYKIHPLRKGVIIAIFYVALNLDRSHIHLSHLKRLLKSEQINIKNCTKYVPEDLDVRKIPHFLRFSNSLWNEYSTTQICTIVNSLFNNLDLGLPLIPDIRKIIEDFMTELCLPSDFKCLIESLIHHYPCRYFKVSQQIREFTFIADFETICMAYVVIALKMCFGLDSDYEVRLTDVVDKINEENNYPKAFNMYSNAGSTQRLFSFKDWCAYLRTRKMVVCKHNLFMDNYCQTQIADDYVFLEHLQERKKLQMTLGHEISMEIINKIPIEDKVSVIPRDEFNLINIPMTSATNVILEYLQDPDIRLVLSEDFTQYSLDYVTKYLSLKKNSLEKNIIQGVTLDNKIRNPIGPKSMTTFHKTSRESENVSVFVKFCDNDEYNLLKSEKNKNMSMDESSFNKEFTITETGYEDYNTSKCEKESSEIIFTNERTIKFVDYPNACIYDEDDKTELKEIIQEVSVDQQPENLVNTFSPDQAEESTAENSTNLTEVSIRHGTYDLPQNFDRKAIIDELINIAYQKHNIKPARTRKVSKPPEKKNPSSLPKKKKKENTNNYNLLSLYYQRLQEETNKQNYVSPSPNQNISNNISINNDSIRLQNTTLLDDNIEPNATEIMNDSDVKILENSLDDKELSTDESDDDYTLPPIISDSDIRNGKSISELNKAVKNILSREIAECDEPPAKKIKKDKSQLTEKIGEKIFCGDTKELKEFPYWVVWFNNMGPRANHVPFNKNLYQSFPHSFTFVLHHCSMIIDSCPFLIYRTMYHIEKLIAKDVGNRNYVR
ncbi:uncharacterized protein LOC123712630 [Pieris brassicae]|uniref:uncharacterized protein LOC123712630 n=1 Tax=Pieris brassicae TaxID=7116 RepID=UPI001E6616CF|nr:uncharacterized protein LOC123712630 [Pieris brassicae]